MRTVAYLRVSTAQQDVRSQRLAILEYARQHDFRIDDFIEATASGQASEKRRRLDELLNGLQRGDRLIVSELSRLGRSLGQIVAILDALAKAGIAFVALKENIRVEGKRDIQTKVMTTLFALFAEVERDLISERTREGLAKARASGRKLGRPKGSLGVSRLDGKEDEIRHFLDLGVSKTAIAKIPVSRAWRSSPTTRARRCSSWRNAARPRSFLSCRRSSARRRTRDDPASSAPNSRISCAARARDTPKSRSRSRRVTRSRSSRSSCRTASGTASSHRGGAGIRPAPSVVSSVASTGWEDFRRPPSAPC